MIINFKNRFWKIAKWYALVFVLLFVFRLISGFFVVNNYSNDGSNESYFSNINNIRKNYATEKIEYKRRAETTQNLEASQKYEKTASLKIKTSNFDNDEKILRNKTKKYNAVIQYEKNLGDIGDRELHMLIGVEPNSFDSAYNELKQIGIIKSTDITKVDKTNEYRELNAKKASIEKTLQSLNELKNKGGEIEDFVTLNEKILEIEEKAQELGVELGNFDTENEFCTIKLSMYEGKTGADISFIYRVRVALEWTIKYFFYLAIASLFLSATTFFTLLILDKFRVLDFIKKLLN